MGDFVQQKSTFEPKLVGPRFELSLKRFFMRYSRRRFSILFRHPMEGAHSLWMFLLSASGASARIFGAAPHQANSGVLTQGCAHDHQRSLEKSLPTASTAADRRLEATLNSFNAASFFPDRVSRSGRWRPLWRAARSRSWTRTTIHQRQKPRHPRQSQWRRQ